MNDLIKIVQLPVIEEQLRTLKDRWDQRAADAEAMVCTEDTVKVVKAFRADMRKEFDEVETLRKRIKSAIMEPYERFDAIYKDCVTNAYKAADAACADKISDVETDQKRRCEESLREYFAELCAVHHLDWLKYEDAGINIDMASAKAKTPHKLREQLSRFVAGVADSVERISSLDDASEIMVEFRRTLDAAASICNVQERHRQIEEERTAFENGKNARDLESAAAHRVEMLAPPVHVDPPKTVKCTFTVRTTMNKLKNLKQFLIMEGIDYE